MGKVIWRTGFGKPIPTGKGTTKQTKLPEDRDYSSAMEAPPPEKRDHAPKRDGPMNEPLPGGVLCIKEPYPELDETDWILLYAIANNEDQDGLRTVILSGGLKEWCEWRDAHAKELVGCLNFSLPIDDRPCDVDLGAVLVEKPWRRRGVGTRLVEAMKDICRGLPDRTRIVAVTEFRPKALPFWERMGLAYDRFGRPFVPLQ